MKKKGLLNSNLKFFFFFFTYKVEPVGIPEAAPDVVSVILTMVVICVL